MSRQSSIKYYVNKEKGVCVATLDGVYRDIYNTMRTKLNKLGIDDTTWNGEELRRIYMKNVPNHLTARATCNPNDTFNEEIGCAIARAKLLAKLYRLRANVSAIIGDELYRAYTAFDKYNDYYIGRMCNYLSEAVSDGTIAE